MSPRPKPKITSVRVTRYRTEDGHHHDTLAAAREHAARCHLLHELHDGYCYNSLGDEMSGTTYADLVEWMLNRAEPLSRILREYHNLQSNQVTKGAE